MADEDTKAAEEFEPVGDVPTRAANVYIRVFQFEIWLRSMVYVELRALLGNDWAKDLNPSSRSRDADKALTHMPTAELNPLSYTQLSELLRLVDQHWHCFAGYLPPRDIWVSRLREVTQIRHRAAHFRSGHVDDLARLKQFLRDLDKGFWRFCTSYNDYHPVLPQEGDAITSHFLHLDPLPWVAIKPGTWAQIGTRDKSIPVGLYVRRQKRPWASNSLAESSAGYLYDFYLFAQDGRSLDISSFLSHTRPLHPQLAHLCLESCFSAVRFTVPAVIGPAAIIGLVQSLYDAAVAAARRGPPLAGGDADNVAAAWPEYVLGPGNPLTFLSPDMPCSFFGA